MVSATHSLVPVTGLGSQILGNYWFLIGEHLTVNLTSNGTGDSADTGGTITLELEPEPRSAASARAFLREHAQLDRVSKERAALLVTELVGNAIEHSQPEEVLVTLDQDREREVVVSVVHLHEEPLRHPERGFGMQLLDELSKEWGHHHDGQELAVWFSVRRPGTDSAIREMSESQLWERRDDDPACVEELVRRHADLAASIARRYRNKGIDDDDLLQVANMALLKAVQRFDPTIGKLGAYAASTISGELKRHLRDSGWSVRIPRSLQERSLEVTKATELLAQKLNHSAETSDIAKDLGLTEAEVVEAIGAQRAYASTSIEGPRETDEVSLANQLKDEDPILASADDRVVIREAVDGLPEREQRILQLRFDEDMTQSEIATELNISQMHVSRLLADSLSRLKEKLGRSGLSN